MNRHGYNGLCRYNQSGGFNVPFGRYKKTYFPEKELLFFAEKAKKATFVCKPYQKLFQYLRDDDVLYCDPPYGRVKNDDGTMGNKQISEAGYNAFWKKDDDQRLYDYLKLIDESGSSFMVSGVLRHDDKTCWMLDKLISDGYNYKVLSFDYNKVSRKGKKETTEVIIKNY